MNCGTARSQIANSTAAPGPPALQTVPWCRSFSDLLVVLFPDEKVLLVHPGQALIACRLYGLRRFNSARSNDAPLQSQRTIVFETRAYISYNLKFVY
jgi:hypothetical protein